MSHKICFLLRDSASSVKKDETFVSVLDLKKGDLIEIGIDSKEDSPEIIRRKVRVNFVSSLNKWGDVKIGFNGDGSFDEPLFCNKNTFLKVFG